MSKKNNDSAGCGCLTISFVVLFVLGLIRALYEKVIEYFNKNPENAVKWISIIFFVILTIIIVSGIISFLKSETNRNKLKQKLNPLKKKKVTKDEKSSDNNTANGIMVDEEQKFDEDDLEQSLIYRTECFDEISKLVHKLSTTKNICIHQVDNMSGYEFEKFIADLFAEKSIYSSVSLTQKSHDQGVDIICVDKTTNLRTAVQCKCYSHKLGNTPIQEVVAGKAFYNCSRGIVVTNSFFTSDAIALAEANNIELFDRNWLIRSLEYKRNCYIESLIDITRTVRLLDDHITHNYLLPYKEKLLELEADNEPVSDENSIEQDSQTQENIN